MSDTAKRIAELEKELAESINGYISRKVIKGKERFYLQARAGPCLPTFMHI